MNKKLSKQQILAYILLFTFAAPILITLFNWFNAGRKTNEKAEILAEYKTIPVNNSYKEGVLNFISKDGKNTQKIDIELAKNDAKRSQGLMYRQSMGEMQGMLFIFEKSEPQSFWMKNTFISLDIIYVNEQKEIVSITKMAQAKSELPIPSGLPAIYVVEVNGGFCDRYQIKEGDKIEWQEITP